MFCLSPDVNIKADCFIARLHDGWRLVYHILCIWLAVIKYMASGYYLCG